MRKHSFLLFIIITSVFYLGVSFIFNDYSINFKSLSASEVVLSSSSEEVFSDESISKSDSSLTNGELDYNGDTIKLDISAKFIIFISLIAIATGIVVTLLKNISKPSVSVGFNNENFSSDLLSNYYDVSSSELDKFHIKSKDKIIYESFNIFSVVQDSFVAGDLEKIKSFLSSGLFSSVSRQISSMNNKGIKHIISDIEFVGGRVNDIYQNKNNIFFKVILEINCKDYVIDSNNGEVIKGSSSDSCNYLYELKFSKCVNIKCLYCNHKLSDYDNSNKCEVCGKTINENNNRLVLISKKNLNIKKNKST